jgi:hypothetical protein
MRIEKRLGLLLISAPLWLCGLCTLAFYAVAPFWAKDSQEAIQTNIFAGAFAAICLVFGILFAGRAAGRHSPTASVEVAHLFPRATFWLAAFLVMLLLGMGALALEPLAAWVFPPLHLLATAFFPLALLAYIARQVCVTTDARALAAALGWGAFGSPFLALLLEGMIGVIILVGVGIVFALTSGGTPPLERWNLELSALRSLDEQAVLQFLFAHPALIVLALIYFAGIVPLIEEALKTLILAFMDPARTQARDAVLWGAAAGVGFAIVENALNTGVALELWSVAMLARMGATVMHTATGILMARGWYAARVERRWKRLFLAYLASVIVHALWNVLAAGQAVGVLGLLGATSAPHHVALWVWLNLAVFAALVMLALGGVGWIAYVVRSVRAQYI